MDVNILRERVQVGNYLIKSHVIQHALKEGFERKHVVETVLKGTIIEEYPEDQRVLICGNASFPENISIYLHIVCEYADTTYIEFVTAYIPDELEWENLPFRRRKRKRK